MSKITDSARGQQCQIQLPGCRMPVEGVVWCHSNKLTHGKGIGKKSKDIFGAYGCQYCHDVYDGRHWALNKISRNAIDEYFQYGHDRSLLILMELGLVVCK